MVAGRMQLSKCSLRRELGVDVRRYVIRNPATQATHALTLCDACADIAEELGWTPEEARR